MAVFRNHAVVSRQFRDLSCTVASFSQAHQPRIVLVFPVCIYVPGALFDLAIALNEFKLLDIVMVDGVGQRPAIDAGPGGLGLYDRLTEDGIECIATPPPLIPAANDNRIKTDKKDSLKLARLLDCNMLKKSLVVDRKLLYSTMKKAGFFPLSYEWGQLNRMPKAHACRRFAIIE